MPRRRRQCPPGLPVHVVQRGNNRQACFGDDADRRAYATWLAKASAQFGVEIHAWVFMTNHVHLLLTPRAENAVSRCMQYVGRFYVPYFNRRYDRTGTLWEGRFRSNLVQTSRYLLACQRYIELNPVRAGMVTDPGDYSWSSYRAHAFGIAVGMWRPHAEYLALAGRGTARRAAYRDLFAEELAARTVTDIRQALNTGLVLGNERFRRRVERITGQRQTHRRPGRRCKAAGPGV